jgi:3-oxoacyl-[acyl-carrier protein] reductase
MELGLKDKVAIVTAASSGLGKATALELAYEGAAVVISSRREEAIENAAEDIRAQTGAEVLAVAGDVTIADDVRRLVAQTRDRFGRVDIVVANAGGPPSGYFADFDLDDYRRAIELNLLSTVSLCREVVPLMSERGWGRVVAITSVAAKQPIDHLILSNTARAGLLGFLKSLSQQVAADGITVNTVCPGYHLTERLTGLASQTAQKEGLPVEAVLRRFAVSTPVKRIGDPREFAAFVAFLCSERASFITGTVTQIDGGAYRALY